MTFTVENFGDLLSTWSKPTYRA